MRSCAHERGAAARLTLVSQILARRMRLPRAQTRAVVCRRDLRVPMDDGTILLADRWVSRAGADRPRPTVLVRSPYGRRQLVALLFGRLLAERGLQVVIQSVRGTFGSGGAFSPFDERADGLATLRWLRAQPWHSGAIGTLGPSYLGFVQWAIAADAGDDLAAMSIHVSASQFHGQTYAGSSLALESVASWLVIIATQERRLAPLALGRALRGLDALVGELPAHRARRARHRRAAGVVSGGVRQPGARGPVLGAARLLAQRPATSRRPSSSSAGGTTSCCPGCWRTTTALQAAGRAPAAAHRALGAHVAGPGGRGGARRPGLDARPPARGPAAAALQPGAADGHRRALRRRLARPAQLAAARYPASAACISPPAAS